jgi:ABC-type uncharacterized transport system permease subunit
LLALTWSAAAYAATHAQVAFGSDLARIPMLAYVITIVLSGIGGAASTLQKLSRAADLSRWQLEVVKDTVSAIVAGLLVFFLCESFEWDSAREAFAITIAGYGNSKLIDLMFRNFVKQLPEPKQ